MPLGPNLCCKMKVSPKASAALIPEAWGARKVNERFYFGSVHISGLFSGWEKLKGAAKALITGSCQGQIPSRVIPSGRYGVDSSHGARDTSLQQQTCFFIPP